METERLNIPRYGYGSRAFALTVVQSFRALAPEEDPETIERLRSLAHSIFERDQLELRPGVRETLSTLAHHHQLVLVTKGDREEQEWKVECSGLRAYFHRVEVVDEKNVQTYRALIDRLGLVPSRTWMIGNSPRSDINPALAAGLNAVFVPHPQTWELELEDVVDGGDRLVLVETLVEVLALFAPRDARRRRDS
jgi:putative hydrolase of the HAD superfamily